jgi:hypothetical protein
MIFFVLILFFFVEIVVVLLVFRQLGTVRGVFPSEVWERLYERGVSFSDRLNMGHHDEANGFFSLKDGGVGALVALSGVDDTFLSPEEKEAVAEELRHALSNIGHAFDCQFLVFSGSSDLDKALRPYREHGPIDPLILKSKEDLLLRGAKEGIYPGEKENIKPRSIHIYLSLALRDQAITRSSTALSALRRSHGAHYRTKVEVLGRQVRKTLSDLRSFQPRLAGPEEVISRYYPVLSPNRHRDLGRISDYSPLETLSDQIVYDPVTVANDHVRFGKFNGPQGAYINAISLVSSALTISPGDIVRIFDFKRDFLLAINFSVLAKEDSQAYLRIQRFLNARQERQRGRHEPDALQEAQKSDINEALKIITRQPQEKIVRFSMHGYNLESNLQDLQEASNEFKGILSGIAGECQDEENIAPAILLSGLLFGYDRRFDRFTARSRHWLLSDFKRLCPVFQDSPGNLKSPALQYLTPRGALYYYDMFSAINAHGIIAAATGAGKSFFTNDMIMQYKRLRSLTFIIDVGRSYRKLALMYGGEFVDFDADDPILVNPFMGRFDEDKQDSLTEFVMSIITFNPRNKLDGVDEATIERAIVETYEQAGHREVILEDVLERLRSRDAGERGPYIAELLFKYSKKGRFARYINGNNNLSTGKDLIVFNLDRIKNKELQAVYLMVIIQYIREVFEKTPPGVIKQLFIDEAWGLLENQESAKFLETGYRTYRKLNAGITCITQNPEVDLLQKPSGRAIISSAENVFLLQQKPEVVTMIAKPFQFSDVDVENLKGVKTVPGYYADIMNISGGQKKIFRLYPSKLTSIVSTSRSEDNALIYGKMQRERKDFRTVLDELLEDRSYSFQ